MDILELSDIVFGIKNSDGLNNRQDTTEARD